jgi:hypothetical protein
VVHQHERPVPAPVEQRDLDAALFQQDAALLRFDLRHALPAGARRI